MREILSTMSRLPCWTPVSLGKNTKGTIRILVVKIMHTRDFSTFIHPKFHFFWNYFLIKISPFPDSIVTPATLGLLFPIFRREDIMFSQIELLF
jgi:hypothetical protein